MNVREKPILTLQEAVRRFVPDGQELLLGGFAFSDPTAVAHEIIRQGRRGLRVIKSSGGVLVDQLIGAGCAAQLLSCHIWNSVGPVPAHCFRRAIERERPAPIAIEELSYGALSMALLAGACDFPFMPTTPLQGTGHFTERTFWPDKLGVVRSPFGGEPVTVVSPLKPELGIFHVHRVDRAGNAQVFGPLGETRFAMAACRRLVVVAEELVDADVIRGRPELTVAPSFLVDAVVIEPWAAHPSDSYGYYYRDLAHHALYGEMSRTEDGFQRYLEEWVFGTQTHSGFIRTLGDARVRELMTRKEPWW
ncbi:MAG TPA: CoA-transferase [bacterium]|nr:CoA-transferase [bacterium]